ncbi:YcaO-like family protein [Sulfurimonas sp.]|uniref:YcaO-like family protein n=1 Tax=Sulfurimonas sp. TaxID=2022749 RepID=UPI0025EA7F71|nr:YcaO-like family protein [Sulfurimonas sp.]MDD5157712.1 YcaO-like family protein [Sulfurimonas sp.]
MDLLSKSAPLEESISKMKSVLEAVGCEVIFSHQKHPLQNCFSVNLASAEAPKHIYSNGKGVVEQASVASALGEYIERLQTNNFFTDFYLGGEKHYPDEIAFEFGGNYLSNELTHIYDPLEQLTYEDLVDFNSDFTDKIVALPFVKHSTKESIYFPVNILNNLYVSNGLATGNTPKEAQVQALSEIFERYAKIEIIKNGYTLPKFPQEILEQFEKVSNDILALRNLGYIVEVLDASLGGKFPVTAISLINQKNSTIFVSFGSHPILEVSLERTMSELMQGRNLDNLDTFETPTFDMSVVSDSFNIESHFVDSNGKLGFGFLSSKKSFEYASWAYAGSSTEDEHNFLFDILDKIGKELYLREYDYLGFYSCQMIVPSLSEVYPIEDLIYNNKNSGKFLRDFVLNYSNYDPEDILFEIEQLDDSLDVGKYIGVIFEESFSMRELKAQTHLLLGNKEEALELLQFETNKLGYIVAELLRADEQNLSLEDYEEGMIEIFTSKKYQKALKAVTNEGLLFCTKFHLDYLNILEMYKKLQNRKVAYSKK